MAPSSFITSTPVLRPSRTSTTSAPRSGRRGPTSAISGPPPARPSGGDAGDGPPQSDALRAKQAKLDALFTQDVQPRAGRTGQCDCLFCAGTKQRPCSWCDGKGFRRELVAKSWEQLADDIEKMKEAGGPAFMKEPEEVPVTCSACRGSKKLRCGYCRGSGVGSYGHAY